MSTADTSARPSPVRRVECAQELAELLGGRLGGVDLGRGFGGLPPGLQGAVELAALCPSPTWVRGRAMRRAGRLICYSDSWFNRAGRTLQC
jgi:hypothetical protein